MWEMIVGKRKNIYGKGEAEQASHGESVILEVVVVDAAGWRQGNASPVPSRAYSGLERYPRDSTWSPCSPADPSPWGRPDQPAEGPALNL